MRSNIQLQKEILSPPGDTIQETIDSIGMSQSELADRMGRPKEKINDIIKGREPISLKTAFLLERVLRIPVSFWMEREREYRVELGRIEQQEFLEKEIDWLNHFPVNALINQGFLPDTKVKTELVDALLRFFSVASPVEWQKIYIEDAVAKAFKISLANTQSPHAISAWIRIGEIKAFDLKLPDFDKAAFIEALEKIKGLVIDQPGNFKNQLQELCHKVGVAVLYTSCLPKAPISGAAWWKGRNAIIQLTGRYKTNDRFWFDFYHEAAHILKHGRKDIFLEDLAGTKLDEEKEKEANMFAQKYLFPSSAMERLVNVKMINDMQIIEFAQKYQTHPGIIVGQLQHSKKIPFNQGNHLKVPINLFD